MTEKETVQLGVHENLAVGMPELIALQSLGRMTGPKGKDFAPMLEPESLWELLPSDVRDDNAKDVLEQVANTYDRRMNRIKKVADVYSPSVELGREIAQATTEVLRKIASEAPSSELGKDAREGAARIVRDMKPERALHYLDEEFVSELQDLVDEDTPLWHAIGNYFGMSELLRRAKANLNPDTETIASVNKAKEILTDSKSYLEGLGVEDVDDSFVQGLTPEAILQLTTRTPQSTDEVLLAAAHNFESFKQLYPKVLRNTPIFATSLLLRITTAHGLEVAQAKLAEAEHAIEIVMREGYDERAAAFCAIQLAHGDISKLPKILASKGGDRLFRDYGNDGEVANRKRAALMRGTLSRESAGSARHGLEYRDLLFDIDESYKLKDADKRMLYEGIDNARQNFARHTYEEEKILGLEIVDNERKQFDAALTDTLYAFKYLLDCGERTQAVPMGSKTIDITPSLQELLLGIQYLQIGTKNQLAIRLRKSIDTLNAGYEPNSEIGRVANKESRALVLTKLQYGPASATFERGKGQRINKIVGISSEWPAYDKDKRQKNSLSFRLDLDRDGILRLDIGGKTDDYDTPDFIVARMISLGRWYRAWLRDGRPAEQSYHSELMAMSQQEFSERARAYRAALTYVEPPLQTAAAPVQAVQPAQADARILEQHLGAQDQTPAA